MVVVVAQLLSHVQLFWDTIDCSPPDSSVRGISQARILEWLAISFSRWSSRLRDWTHIACTGRRILYHWAIREALLHGSQHCHSEGACITQWIYEPSNARPPRWAGHSEEFWQNVVHWRRKWQPTLVFLPGEPHGQHEKSKRYNAGRSDPQVTATATGEEQRAITNSSSKNEEARPKREQHSAVHVFGSESKVWGSKEYRTGIWNVRSVDQDNLDVVKQEMARLNTDILRIRELKWTKMGEFNSHDHFIYYCGQESLRRNEVALTVNKSPKYSTWLQSEKQQNNVSLFSRQTIQHQH